MLWLGLGLFRLIQYPISIIFFPVAYPFRKKAYEYAKGKPGKDYKLFHPLSIANWFFTKDDDSGNYYTGPYWYKKELKEKVFDEYEFAERREPVAKTFKQKLVYFYIAYCWCGFRNFMWNLYRLVYYDVWDSNREFSVKKEDLVIHKNIFYPRTESIFPQAKFTDKEGEFRDNSGPMILYPTMNFPLEKCTIEGVKNITFRNSKGKLRFQNTSVKIIPIKVIKKILVIELFTGWNRISGAAYFHCKLMFKKFKGEAVKDYGLYRKTFE
jgi:hypothetical protein